jgi:hypothetical protein
MHGKILLIANQMFPEPSLPNTSFPSFHSRLRYRYIPTATGKPKFRESPFYHAPSHGEIIVIWCHLPYKVTMVRQERRAENSKRTRGPNFSDGPM